MTDLDTLLSQAAHSPDAPAAEGVVDADLARGRRALNHRRMRRTGTRSVLAGALAIGAFAALSPGSHPATTGTAIKPSTGTATTKAPTLSTTKSTTGTTVAGIKLVAYTGEQPKGYTVDSVPAGWELQGVNNFALVIAPVGDTDTRIDSFKDKLVVMLESADQQEAPTGDAVMVGAAHGVVSRLEDNEGPILYFTDAAGHRLDIQVPAALHWSNAQVAAFGAAVHVNASAEPGLG